MLSLRQDNGGLLKKEKKWAPAAAVSNELEYLTVPPETFLVCCNDIPFHRWRGSSIRNDDRVDQFCELKHFGNEIMGVFRLEIYRSRKI